MDEDDDFGDVVDFGDGVQYTIGAIEDENQIEAVDDEAVPDKVPKDEFSRGTAGRSEGRSLFNERLGKFEPYAGRAKKEEGGQPAQVLHRPRAGERVPRVAPMTLPKAPVAQDPIVEKPQGALSLSLVRASYSSGSRRSHC